jgi:putative ATP-dependent endonuclease of OLD family
MEGGMKLVEVKIENFRGYQAESSITFEDMTVLIGKNDAGKSAILDALNIYFNDAVIEKDDACVFSGAGEVKISCVFSEHPRSIVVDEQHPTSLEGEYLVRKDGMLEICRVFNCAASKVKQSGIYAKAYHPSADGCSDLLTLKIKDLKTRAKERSVDLTGVNQTISSAIRQAIWLQTENLVLSMQDVDLASETGKKVWEQIQLNLPVFALFKSDRASTDQDEEAQDPMKAAIKETLKGHEVELNNILDKIRSELERVVSKTVEKIQEMSPELAKQLDPQIKNKNWDSLFSVSLTGENGIPINKRGSGTRRLVLLNFFRAQAEDSAIGKNSGVIYAIEEPETSQHPYNQLLLLNTFQDLVDQGRCQIILSTHNPTLARRIDCNSLRLVASQCGNSSISDGSDDTVRETIKSSLGVLPDHDIRVFFGVEGKWDIAFLKTISKILSTTEDDIPDLNEAENKGHLVFVPLGGSSLELWTARLAGLNRPEFYLTDRDNPPPQNPKYQRQLEQWNARNGCKAWSTDKRELENYLHPDTIRSIDPSFSSAIANFDDVPLILAEHLHKADPISSDWVSLIDEKKKEKAKKAKGRLNKECVVKMTPEMLNQTDPNNEIRGWLREIGIALKTEI